MTKTKITDRDIFLIDRALAYAIAGFEQGTDDERDARDMRRLLEARVGKDQAEDLVLEEDAGLMAENIVAKYKQPRPTGP